MLRCSIRAIALMILLAVHAAAADPLDVVRSFCRADAEGNRLRARTWSNVGRSVAWELEPAWDRITLIRGYEISTPRMQGEGIACTVTYTVVGEIPAGGSQAEREETHTFQLVPTEPDSERDSWRIVGPPPVPHVFADRVDREAMKTLLDPRGGYTSAPAAALQLLQEAGWNLPQLDTVSLFETSLLQTVEEAEPGDLVFYLGAGGRPYHVGVMDAESQVVSATLNAGMRRAPLDAFAGTVVHRRPVPPEGATPVATSQPE